MLQVESIDWGKSDKLYSDQCLTAFWLLFLIKLTVLQLSLFETIVFYICYVIQQLNNHWS